MLKKLFFPAILFLICITTAAQEAASETAEEKPAEAQSAEAQEPQQNEPQQAAEGPSQNEAEPAPAAEAPANQEQTDAEDEPEDGTGPEMASQISEKKDEEKQANGVLIKTKAGTPLKYFELYGYFGVANNFTYNMMLSGNNPYLASRNTINNVTTDETTGEKVLKSSNERVLNWAWMKLHLEPVINIAEIIEIHTKLSIFGNTALGANNYEIDRKTNGLLRDAQLATSASIIFEGLWGVFDTPIGELKIGRMPFHWGLGILYNEGNRFNSQSSGNYLDRIQLTIPVSKFKIIPAFDLASTGMLDRFHDYLIDASQKDDGFNVSLMFTMQEDDQAILMNKLMNDKTVIEAGAMVMFSWKNYSSGTWKDEDKTVDPTDDAFIDPNKVYAYTSQSAKLWKLDAWFKLHLRNFSFQTELAFMTGSIGKILMDDGKENSVKTMQVGFAIDMVYRIIPRKFHLSLLTGLASPDDADYVQGDSWNTPGLAVRNSAVNSDRSVDNFRFNKDYNFNSALWNQFLGRFTAGYYASLEADYFFIDDLKGYLGLTYTMALKKNNSLGGKGLPNAVEPYIGIDYANRSGFRLGTRYQFGVPLSGLDTEEHDTYFYHFLNVYIGVVF